MNLPSESKFIFDLDGTLVQSWEFNEKLYVESLKEVLVDIPFSEAWHEYENVTDSGVLQEILRSHACADTQNLIKQVREVFGRRVSQYLQSGGACTPTSGAKELLCLLKRKGVGVGIATGGWKHTAMLKLSHAGIDAEGIPIFTGDDAVSRTEIMRLCSEKIGAKTDKFVYFGDGQWDVKAADHLGWMFIGIGPKLQGHCEYWHPDFNTLNSESMFNELVAPAN